MPVIDRQRISDGFLTLERGVDAGRSPNLLSRNQASFAGNVTMRGGYAKTRPAFVNIPLKFDVSFKKITSGTLVVGKKYKITKTGSGFDVTGVGAANNNVDTEFVATGTTPNWGDASGGGGGSGTELNSQAAARTWATNAADVAAFNSAYTHWEAVGLHNDSLSVGPPFDSGVLDMVNKTSTSPDVFAAGVGIKWTNPTEADVVQITLSAGINFNSNDWYINYGAPDAQLIEDGTKT